MGEPTFAELADRKTEESPKRPKMRRSTLNYLIDMGLAVSFVLVFATGILKFSSLVRAFGGDPSRSSGYGLTLVHDYSGLIMGLLVLAHLALHASWLKKTTLRLLKEARERQLHRKAVAAAVVLLLLGLILREPAVQEALFGPDNELHIEDVGSFAFTASEVETLRPDIFSEGHFSIFDILVHLDEKGKIGLDYHFNETTDTYEIDSLNGKGNWWYDAYYSGGWRETSVFRMDHYPFKDGMFIELSQSSDHRLQRMNDSFAVEVARREANGGRIVVPEVRIRGRHDTLVFKDVEVTAHNKRDDFLQEGVITALDVIMSLGDQELIDYELQWYETVGLARVKNYFVQRINDDEGEGRCGFVYESGEEQYRGSRGNHIHIISDIRVISSPEYVEWFWICI